MWRLKPPHNVKVKTTSKKYICAQQMPKYYITDVYPFFNIGFRSPPDAPVFGGRRYFLFYHYMSDCHLIGGKPCCLPSRKREALCGMFITRRSFVI
ncbi:MAG: hypothetical protein LBH93_04630 [Chitinispirillales bacterium]|nr:hypothetical protein [Chitinispirillales bacterium]